MEKTRLKGLYFLYHEFSAYKHGCGPFEKKAVEQTLQKIQE